MRDRPPAQATDRPSVRVTVAVPTFRRPRQLAVCLPRVIAQASEVGRRCSDRFTVDVLVVDNSPEAGARDFVESQASPSLRYAHEPRRGLCAVRNTALTLCHDRDLLVFIDDDEFPGESWLAPLLDLWWTRRPSGVKGRVVSTYEREPDPWVAAGEFFVRTTHPTGASIPAAATNNLLLDLRDVRSLGLRFDSRLTFSGGEDSLFTRQLTAHGGEILWCDESVVWDPVPPARTETEWLLTRFRNNGNTDGLVRLFLAGSPAARVKARAMCLLTGVGKVAFGAGRAAWGLTTRDLRHRARGRRTAYRGFGMTAAAFGRLSEEYRYDEPASASVAGAR